MSRVQFAKSWAREMEMGGQAVIEGVLMRVRRGYAVAVRRPSGAVLVRQVPYRPLNTRLPLLKLPVLRGMVALIEMVAIGARSLQWSAEEYERQNRDASADFQEEASGRPFELPRPLRQEVLPENAGEAFRQASFLGMMAISLGLVVLMVIVAPNLLAWLVGKLPFVHAWAEARGTLGFSEENHPVVYNLVSGLFRGAILVGYVVAISFNRDVRRVFEYHGAEHKAVLALEDGEEITVANAQARDTLHPRCGTTFLAVVVLLSILFFAAAASFLNNSISGFPDWPFWQRKLATLGSHIMMLPLVAGTAFELMKFCARHEGNPFCAALLWPGFRFQRLTTRQPDDEQVEVAIVAMLAALAIDEDIAEAREYVVRGLHDDESAPGYSPPKPVRQEKIA